MKVILSADVKGQGIKGQLIEASDGYARNFLLPKGLAVEANKANINVMTTQNQSVEFKKQEELKAANMLEEKLSKITVTIYAKAGESGRLFGSVTSKEIADILLNDYKIKIDKKKINLPDGIKILGVIKLDVKLYPGVVAQLTVDVKEQK